MNEVFKIENKPSTQKAARLIQNFGSNAITNPKSGSVILALDSVPKSLLMNESSIPILLPYRNYDFKPPHELEDINITYKPVNHNEGRTDGTIAYKRYVGDHERSCSLTFSSVVVKKKEGFGITIIETNGETFERHLTFDTYRHPYSSSTKTGIKDGTPLTLVEGRELTLEALQIYRWALTEVCNQVEAGN